MTRHTDHTESTSFASPRLSQLKQQLETLLASQDSYPVHAVEALFTLARELGASDLHLIPISKGGALRCQIRLNGVLVPGPDVPLAGNVIARLKVLAGLLTYRSDLPQEGRVKTPSLEGPSQMNEIRVSTFPTLHGEKAVVRFFIASNEYQQLHDLGYPEDVEAALSEALGETSGLLLVCGPAGSGKTTTAYALLRELLHSQFGLRSLCTLEDPVEAEIPGVAQSQVRSESGLTYQSGLRSLMRQDPDVIFVGEIRDQETAQIVFQAALTGHLVVSTFHASSAAEAISRLTDMQIEPYILRSTLLGLLAQRLVRQSCEASEGHAVNCRKCNGTGYLSRFPLVEFLPVRQSSLSREILVRNDTREIESAAVKSGMISMIQRARIAVEQHQTTAAECLRVLGPGVFPSDRTDITP